MIGFKKIKKEGVMRFIRDLSWETQKMLERIYQRRFKNEVQHLGVY